MNSKNILSFSGLLSYIVFFMICERMLGCAGTGIIVASLSMYSFFFIVLMGSVMSTLSKMVFARRHRGFFDNAKRIFGYCLFYTAIVGSLAGLGAFFSSSKLARLVYADNSTSMIVMTLGLFFLIDSFVRTIRGYYLGCEHSIAYTIAIVVKSLSLIISCPILIKLFSGIGVKAANLHKNQFLISVYGAVGAVMAIVVADLLMLLILLLGLRFVLHTDSFSFNEVRSKDGFINFLKSFIPASFSVLKENLFPCITIFFAICFYCRSSFKHGATVDSVYSNVGAVGVPAICTVVLALLFYKEYAENFRKKMRNDYRKDEKKALVSKFNHLLKGMMTIIFPLAFSVMMFAEAISKCVYGCENAAAKSLLIWGGLIILFKGIDVAFTKSLDAIGRESLNFLGRMVGLACAVLLMFAVNKNGINVSVVLIALVIDIVIATIIHGVFAVKDITIRVNDIAAKSIKISISIVLMIIVELILSKFVAKNLLLLLLSILIGYTVFLVSFVLIRGVNQKEINNLSGTFIFYPLTLLSNIFNLK